jgi:PDZ domain-containing protein
MSGPAEPRASAGAAQQPSARLVRAGQRLLGRPAALWLLLLALVVLAGQGLPSPYSRLSPGGAYELSPRIQVPPELRREIGWLAFTAVRVRPASYADWLLGAFDRSGRLVPTSTLRPADVQPGEYVAVRRQLMEHSKAIASVVALKRAGYEIDFSQGALVEQVSAASPAAGHLQSGDVVLAADGQAIRAAGQLGERIRQRQVGQPIVLDLLRDGRTHQISVPTVASPAEPGRPILGLRLSSFVFAPRLPFPIQLESDSVIGPSAGFMFSLGLLDALTEGDLGGGHRVAGTGTLDVAGQVGPVGGVTEKVVAAEHAGADLFLVPRANLDQAVEAARTTRVIPIDSVDQALAALGEMGGGLPR